MTSVSNEMMATLPVLLSILLEVALNNPTERIKIRIVFTVRFMVLKFLINTETNFRLRNENLRNMRLEIGTST